MYQCKNTSGFGKLLIMEFGQQISGQNVVSLSVSSALQTQLV